MKKACYTFLIVLILLFLFFRPNQAVEASTTGLLLWFHTIIPTLLPFIILSNVIIRLDAMSYLTWFLSPVLTRLLGISKNGCYAVITGFLCGYPMGSKVTADLVSEGQISMAEGQYLLDFCNNVSPMFIISFIVTVSLQNTALIMPFLVILYASPLLTALVLNPFYRRRMAHAGLLPHQTQKASRLQINFKIIDASIMNGFETVTKLGGYIILFAIIAKMVSSLPIPSEALKCLSTGIFEITNGIQATAASSIPDTLKQLMILGVTSFGGLSSIAQTESMIKDSGLSILKYIGAKLLSTCFTLLLALPFLLGQGGLIPFGWH